MCPELFNWARYLPGGFDLLSGPFYGLHFIAAVVNTTAVPSQKKSIRIIMIRQFLILFSLIFLTLTAFTAPLAAEKLITLNLPETVIAKAIAAILPLRIDAHSKSIEGDITIINISELQLTDNHLACRLHLAGSKLALLAEIAGHEIKLKVGSVEIDFKTEAEIRFDTKQQILFIKPVVKDVAPSNNGSNADIGRALIAVLNGREFPITMQELKPFIARAGSKTITINSSIANIEAKPKSIQLSLLPEVSAQ
jgi:hypothetical protein